jgi:hypothetical protein
MSAAKWQLAVNVAAALERDETVPFHQLAFAELLALNLLETISRKGLVCMSKEPCQIHVAPKQCDMPHAEMCTSCFAREAVLRLEGDLYSLRLEPMRPK